MKKDYYGILNITRKAKPSQIKKAYRSAAKRHHPDVSPHDEEKFKEIQEAYETLSDPEKRAIYDRQDLEPPIHHTRSYRSTKPMDFSYILFNEIDRLFASLGDFRMNDMPDFWGEKGESRWNHSIEIALTPAEARKGCKMSLKIPFRVNCTRCRGTGRVGGLICGLCRGQGEGKIEKRIKVDIPAGVKDGMKVRIPLRGPDLKEADLFATVRVDGY